MQKHSLKHFIQILQSKSLNFKNESFDSVSKTKYLALGSRRECHVKNVGFWRKQPRKNS